MTSLKESESHLKLQKLQIESNGGGRETAEGESRVAYVMQSSVIGLQEKKGKKKKLLTHGILYLVDVSEI